MKSPGLPPAQGLYDPRHEHDACGVGFIANLNGRKSNLLVLQALRLLVSLQHRGATGCEANTGDGAGILTQIPHRYYEYECGAEGFRLPKPGEYGMGCVFLPAELGQRILCQEVFEQIVREEGQAVLGWRKVPQDNSLLGESAREVEPDVRQIFIGRNEPAGGTPAPQNAASEDAFERKLFLIRKRVERAVRESGLRNYKYFYVPSLSCRTVVYKGMLSASQLEYFYRDLGHPLFESALALVHQRFSTNTFPTWDLAHPFRYLAHNGEINTLRGNINWMRAREALFETDCFTQEEMRKLLPVLNEHGSDSMMLDNALEMLVMCGRSLPQAMMMLLPEAWSGHESMSQEKKDFYEFHACMMEPWDGPAAVAFTDGRVIGAMLDRNGLRPSRYYVTKDGVVVMASEAGVLPEIEPQHIAYKGRVQPGRMFLMDLAQKRILGDEELKHEIASAQPYGKWLKDNLVALEELPLPASFSIMADSHNPHDSHTSPISHSESVFRRQQLFGYTAEDLKIILAPMATAGAEPLGSMGNDTPLAVLSDKPQLLYGYFKQLFAQVTNPPLDAIREELVTSVETTLGPEGNILKPGPDCCRQIKLHSPILDNEELARLRGVSVHGFKAVTLPMLFPVRDGASGLRKALDELCAKAVQALRDGYKIIILSDRGADAGLAPVPSLLATAGVHHHLVRNGLRTQVGLVVESGEPREVHHVALLLGFGAGAINPYLAYETLELMHKEGRLPEERTTGVPPVGTCGAGVSPARTGAGGTPAPQAYIQNYKKALKKGVVKVMSKMGISTVQSYRGAQIFEAIGLNREVVDQYFTGTASRIQGAGLEAIAHEVLLRHEAAYSSREAPVPTLDAGGQYQWRREGEYHLFNPETIQKLQRAVRNGDRKVFQEYSELINGRARKLCTLRGLFEFKFDKCTPVPLAEVEPAGEIVKRFASGAMSYGSISKEAHETLAIAMNRLGGKSNTGEGGEDAERFQPDPNGDSRMSAIKQVASARFGVTSEYLVHAQELQIKMAQGAKPGEGGQLPAAKVYPWIAKTRHATPHVQLISPPPHHDIYSIEDLAQLIHDLKNANPRARVSVKLVAEVGVGTIAAGVSKAHADVVLISGHDGGTAAAPLTGIKHAGIPWELGLAETQQTLLLNDLRSRILVQTDGQLKTGRDVAVAALLGAEEYGFATAPLVSLGCVMMRKCHLDTCPVGIATQNPELRRKFAGRPEHVMNFMLFVAEELREIMARLGFRTVNEMVGRVDLLDTAPALEHWKARGLDFSAIFRQGFRKNDSPLYRTVPQDHALDQALDNQLIRLCRDTLETGRAIELRQPIRNTNRTAGTMLGGEVTRRHGGAGLPDDTITIRFSGSAGQSFGAFLPRGITLCLEGDANDYLGKGLSGGKIIVRPPPQATFVAHENVIAGNVLLYGATSGEAYIRGLAGERFCVRNSGASAVVEGVGDHACEYMTGGRVVVLGQTGRNFAAGMSGGVAYVFDPHHDFARRCNLSMVGLEAPDEEDLALLKGLIEKHQHYTGSTTAEGILAAWPETSLRFVKVMPTDLKRLLLKSNEPRQGQKQAARPDSRKRMGNEVPEVGTGQGQEEVSNCGQT
ncbi:MAG: glutamate synthase-related protein [Planctomycetota bacterium]